MILYLQVAAMAILQGLAEFLPVSSSGHLAVLGAVFGLGAEENLSLGVIMHAGSLLAIVCFYFTAIIRLFRRENWKVIGLLVIATIPAGIAGVAMKKCGILDDVFSNLYVTGAGFIITATLLIISEKIARRNSPDCIKTELNQLSVSDAVCIGLLQGVAVLPGISRSGSTICGGLMRRIERKKAAAFSFLLALPAIAGGALLEVLDIVKLSPEERSQAVLSVPLLVFAMVISAAVSLLSLALLVKLLKKGSWVFFSYYLYLLGATVIIYKIYEAVK